MSPAPLPSMHERCETVIHDQHGAVVVRMALQEYTIYQPDGSSSTLKRSENILLSDGSAWNLAMLLGSAPRYVAACPICRDPRRTAFGTETPTHGLTLQSTGQACHDCGSFLCPKHLVRSVDGQPRCWRCHRWARLKRILMHMFFKRED